MLEKTLIFPAKYGFCGGVIRAISMIEKALKEYTPPVYVHHPIVHNEHVVKYFEDKGVVFVDDLNDIPKTTNPVFLSAHGSPLSLKKEAQNLNLKTIDAVCPLVEKIHIFIKEKELEGYQIILIGSKRTHQENIGTMGQVSSPTRFISKTEDIKKLPFSEKDKLCFVTQTTLSVDETKEIIKALKKHFPQVIGMPLGNICRATTDRQESLKNIIQKNDLKTVIILGSKTSSNTKNLVKTAQRAGVQSVALISTLQDLKQDILKEEKIGITAGASTPQSFIEKVLKQISQWYKIEIQKN